MARKPSHFGSYRNPRPSGSTSASLASIGSIGGSMANPCAISRVVSRVATVRLKADPPYDGPPKGGPHVLRDAGDVDLADVVDLVALHRQALEPVADADRRVPRRVAAQMTDDAIGEDTPGEHLGPLALVFDLELPRLAAHRVLRGDDLHRPPRQHALHRLQHARCDLPRIEPRAIVEPQHVHLVER